MPESNYYVASAGPRSAHAALVENRRADVCVVGGGFTGLSAALHLAEAGLDVVVLEAGRVGGGASGRNGGQIGSGQRRGLFELEALVGREQARALSALAEEGKATLRERIGRHAIDCDLREGNLLGITRERFAAGIAREAEHAATHYGYPHLTLLDRNGVREAVATDAYVAGLMDADGGHLHPLKLALGMARAAGQAGATLHEHTRVAAFDWGSPTRVRTQAGVDVSAEHVLLCCNAHHDDLEPGIAAHVLPIVNHVLATAPLGDDRARALIPSDACVHATKFVVDYYRCTADGRLLFGGGETYSSCPPADLSGFVRKHMLAVFPGLADVEIDYAWSGLVGITRSRLPHFGRVGTNGLFAHGFSGHGVAMTQIAGKLLAEAVRGRVERFDTFANLPHRAFPGGPALRHPLMVLGMLWYALRDRL